MEFNSYRARLGRDDVYELISFLRRLTIIRPHSTAHVVLKFLIDLTHTMLMECACSLMAAVVGSRGTSMGM